ncbi:hypothetical protein TIFTF001_029095 [Ficus carica]|uniref:Uncharacterized protein n=1 Tax=Ficus carica TaxID=3494 RepID=A0AA88J2Y0_FICCA|nr:hypothetical protein TIFTF001_029095 [Ficus carica]
MRSGIPTNTRQPLRRRSPAKRKHLRMMGTPVWCLPWELRCLSVLSGPGCSGRPDRIDRLGSRGMVSVADRYRSKAGVSCEGRGLVQETHAGTGFTTRIQVLRALHRPSIWPVPARAGEVVGQRSCSRRTSGSKHCRSEHGRRIGQQTASGEAHPCATCRWCHVPHHHGREGKATLRILKFQTSNSNGELVGSPIAASKTAPGFYAQPSPINREGQSAFSTIAYEDSSFCRELPKTAEDYQAKDLEDQRRQLPRR